jgi:plasmid stabilization system protein ParE
MTTSIDHLSSDAPMRSHERSWWLRPWVSRTINAALKRAGLRVVRERTIDGWLSTIEQLERELQQGAQQLVRTGAELVVRSAELAECQQALNAVNGRWDPLRGNGCPVYVHEDGLPSLAATAGTAPHRTLICSLPKSGTYLFAELLRALGQVPTNVHVSAESFTDYRFADIGFAKACFRELERAIPLTRVARMMRPGQFTVGHLGPEIRSLVPDFKILFVYRDLRDGMVSYVRWLQHSGRHPQGERGWWTLDDGPQKLLTWMREDGDGPGYVRWCANIAAWLDAPDAIKISFETIYGDNGPARQQQAVNELCRYLELPGNPPQAGPLVERVLATPSLTRSSGRSRREQFWNSEVEAVFRSLGGQMLNERLGY